MEYEHLNFTFLFIIHSNETTKLQKGKETAEIIFPGKDKILDGRRNPEILKWRNHKLEIDMRIEFDTTI